MVDQSPTRAAMLANDVAGTLITQQANATKKNNDLAQGQIQQHINAITIQMQDKQASKQQIAQLETQLNGWQTALDQLALSQAQNGDPLYVSQPAQPADVPIRPITPLYTGVGLLVGLLLGILLAMLFERLDTRVRTPEGITQVIGWPVLATIWRASSSDAEEVINPTGHNLNIEPFRILRTNIGFSSLDKPLQSLVVTSAQPRDGKSAIAANVAIFMAKAGKSTLLVDADLRRPTQHVLFHLSPDKLGLSNAVLAFNMLGMPRTSSYNLTVMNTLTLQSELTSDNFSLEPFVHSVGIPNLWVMPSGPLPPNPSEMFESKAMQRFFALIANCGIEVVIFDTPPLLGLSDASIIASKVDGALVVVDTTRATKGKLRQVKAVLSQTGVHVLGCIANKRKHKRNDSSYYYYNYSYTDDYNSGEKSSRNGHVPTVPATPMPVASPSDQRMRSN